MGQTVVDAVANLLHGQASGVPAPPPPPMVRRRVVEVVGGWRCCWAGGRGSRRGPGPWGGGGRLCMTIYGLGRGPTTELRASRLRQLPKHEAQIC